MESAALRRSRLLLLPLLLAVAALPLILPCAGAPASARAPSPSPTPAPAPAPAPEYVNITQVLVYAGDYSILVGLLNSTGVGQKFQRQANETDVGITIFAPKNKAFAAEPAATLLKNVSGQQLQSLLEYHALNSWESLSELQQASNNETATFATYNGGGGKYELNLTNVQGQVEIVTDWNRATIASTLYNARPCSIFALDQVLLPEDLFGLPAPAPAPSALAGEPLASPSSTPLSSSPGSASASGPSASNSSFASPLSSPCHLHALPLLLPFLFFKLF